MSARVLEVCAGSLASCLAAQAGGADRVELCANLNEGGTTPSPGVLAAARDQLQIGLHVMIRPRGGDFLYDAAEIDVMARDITHCKQLGVDGLVLGALTADGEVDVALTQALVALAAPLPVTFHRAFDLARDPEQALAQVLASGCRRLLSSGQAATAVQGAACLQRLAHLAGERLILMPGCGLRADNIASVLAQTGCREFHASARQVLASAMRYRPDGLALSTDPADDWRRPETSLDAVRALVAALHAC